MGTPALSLRLKTPFLRGTRDRKERALDGIHRVIRGSRLCDKLYFLSTEVLIRSLKQCSSIYSALMTISFRKQERENVRTALTSFSRLILNHMHLFDNHINNYKDVEVINDRCLRFGFFFFCFFFERIQINTHNFQTA